MGSSASSCVGNTAAPDPNTVTQQQQEISDSPTASSSIDDSTPSSAKSLKKKKKIFKSIDISVVTQDNEVAASEVCHVYNPSACGAISPALPSFKFPHEGGGPATTVRKTVNMPLCDSAVPVSTLSETDLATLAICPVTTDDFICGLAGCSTGGPHDMTPSTTPRSFTQAKRRSFSVSAGCDAYDGLSLSSGGGAMSSTSSRHVGFNIPE